MSALPNILPADIDAHVAATRAFRKSLAKDRCECLRPTCGVGDCELCGRYQPSCLLTQTRDGYGNDGPVRCEMGVGCQE